MYHTLTFGPEGGNRPTPNSKTTAAGRISTTNACSECRRRKIRCGGSQPCQQCVWSKRPDLCSFASSGRRPPPSRKYVEELQTKADHLAALCARLFPDREPEDLMSLSRHELLDLAVYHERPVPPLRTSDRSDSHKPDHQDTPTDGADALSVLEQAPSRNPAVDEAIRRRRAVLGISDDVNCLSLSFNAQASYVGISSISAVLKVIFLIAPGARSYVAQNNPETALPSRVPSPSGDRANEVDAMDMPDRQTAQKHIDSFFSKVHPMMPMVDEDEFRQTFLHSDRVDEPWLALLNAILALGALAAGTATNEEHLIYFRRASKLLDYEVFGSSNLHLLQALGLLAGYYLHWLNRPNEANALMGAALRMATAMGLHREYPGSSREMDGQIPADTRRRTWWTLSYLDTLASMTTGRPSLGRDGPGITVRRPQPPRKYDDPWPVAALKLLPIVYESTFSKLATSIQDRIAAHMILSHEEASTWNDELIQWHDQLPDILHEGVCYENSSPIPPSHQPALQATMANPADALHVPRLTLHWWYTTLRMLIYRPYLLASSLRPAAHRYKDSRDLICVEACRTIAGHTIKDISTTCPRELIAGWAGVWLMYQAVMVPLVSLFAEQDVAKSGARDHEGNVAAWRAEVETAIAFFENMNTYSLVAKRSKIMVERLYAAACKRLGVGLQDGASGAAGVTAAARMEEGESMQTGLQTNAGAAVGDGAATNGNGVGEAQSLPLWPDADWLLTDSELLEWTALWDNDMTWDESRDHWVQ